MKVLGKNISLCNIFICVLLLAVVYILTTLSSIENFTSGKLTSTDLNYRMGTGLKVSWENKDNNKIENNLNTNIAGEVPLPEGELFMFYKNKFNANCCTDSGSSYSNASGCVCLSKEQSNYLNERGGNRTLTSIY